jgi:hypothetical protein
MRQQLPVPQGRPRLSFAEVIDRHKSDGRRSPGSRPIGADRGGVCIRRQ